MLTNNKIRAARSETKPPQLSRPIQDLWTIFVENGLAAFARDFNHVLEIDYIINAYACDTFIETGTYKGATSTFVATAYPHIHVHTCELSMRSFEVAQSRLAAHENVEASNMSSDQFLRGLFDSPSFERPLVFLDAHGYDYWPLADELAAISFGMVCIHDFDIGHPNFHFDEYDGRKCDISFIPKEYTPVYINNPAIPGGRESMADANRGRAYVPIMMEDKLAGSDRFAILPRDV